MSTKWDLIIVGAGLSGCLAAFRLLQLKPHSRVMILERESGFSRDKTWSFHGKDLPEECRSWVEPLISKTWSKGYSVRFPKYERKLSGDSYHSVRGEDFFAKTKLESIVRFNSRIKLAGRNSVALESGEIFEAHAVVDASGSPDVPSSPLGFQKFVGLNLELEEPHGLEYPILMDACCEQREGFRFFYALPWDARHLLVEDTRYSASPVLKHEEFVEEIYNWVHSQGWRVRKELGTEAAALPIPLLSRDTPTLATPPKIGVAGDFFHLVTGYSFPRAALLAEELASLHSLTTDSIEALLMRSQSATAGQRRYNLLLNRLMFCAADMAERRKIFERFYTLPEPLIGRFYADKHHLWDKLRILIGKPPVPIRKAIAVVFGSREIARC